jgi:hypothetical protein
MKTLLSVIAACLLTLAAQAQTGYTPEEMDKLLGPVALYPDPLIALVLPAATDPSDLALAGQYLAANGSPEDIDAQPWDPSVKGLAHYPDVLNWMNANPEWTSTLGAAFASQPTDVMQSIQQLRMQAKAAGTLADTPQQSVDMEGDDVRIVPVDANVIYVPQYDPNAVYGETSSGDAGPYITFGPGYPVGPWLGFECNWDDFGIWSGPWRPGWDYHRDWRDSNRAANGHLWRPDPRHGPDLAREGRRAVHRLPSPRPIVGGFRPVNRAAGTSTAYRPFDTAQPQSRPDYRGYETRGASPAPAAPAPRGELYGGYARGTETRANSARGQSSRSAPVRQAAPARAAPSGGGGRAPGGGGGGKRH